MKPLIAISCGTTVSEPPPPCPRDFANRTYSEAIRQAGGAPILLPFSEDELTTQTAIRAVHGLLITGGADISPANYKQEKLPLCGEADPLRDNLDRWTLAEALQRDLPILGICRGIQALSAFMGGSLYQDIPSQITGALTHRQKGLHTVEVKENSMLASIVGSGELSVNSRHHQAVAEVPVNFTASALAPDGLIEALEMTTHSFCLGVQWHPENLTTEDPRHQAIFEAFMRAAQQWAVRAPKTFKEDSPRE